MAIPPLLAVRQLKSILLVLCLSLAACGKEQSQQDSSTPVVSVTTQTLTTSDLLESSEFLANLEATQRVTIAPRVDGRIIEITVTEGDRVRRGQILIKLQQEREKAEVNAAIANVNISQADLANSIAKVKTAEAEVARRQAEIERSKADLRRQEAEVNLAKTNIERAKFLVKEGAESKQFLDNSTKDWQAAIAQRDALKQALDASQKALLAAKEEVTAVSANVESEQAKLNQARARVEIAQENLEFNQIFAPINGIIGDIALKIGDYVEAGDSITTITQNSNLDLNISVPIEQGNRLKLGLPVVIKEKSTGKDIKGSISFISPRVKPNQQSILVKASFPNNASLQDEQLIKAKIIWSEKPGILIPTTAISRIAGQSFIFVAQNTEQAGQNKLIAKQKIVKLGRIQGQAYQVISGVNPGEQLITSGILNLADGTPINIQQVSFSQSQAE